MRCSATRRSELNFLLQLLKFLCTLTLPEIAPYYRYHQLMSNFIHGFGRISPTQNVPWSRHRLSRHALTPLLGAVVRYIYTISFIKHEIRSRAEARERTVAAIFGGFLAGAWRGFSTGTVQLPSRRGTRSPGRQPVFTVFQETVEKFPTEFASHIVHSRNTLTEVNMFENP